jgi:kumamolisin
MKGMMLYLFTATVFLFVLAQPAPAQNVSPGSAIVTPESSVERPEDLGVRAHTNILLVVPRGGLPGSQFESIQPQEAPPYPGFFYETPASLACIYHLVRTSVPGCNPNNTTENPTGGGNAIAVVDAYDYPTAASDLSTFSAQFGLPAANFTVVYASGTRPSPDPTGGWELEEALDIEWSHAMAPKAKIFLVEAASNSNTDLLTGVAVASKLVAENGGGEVSMSWGEGEFSGETAYDNNFTKPGVVYFASSGDSPGVEWPSASPNIVSAGGTSTVHNPVTGAFEGSIAWQSGGGGPSAYERRPRYQNSVASSVGGMRGTPDLSFDADPDTGVWIYDTTPYEFLDFPPAGIQTVVIGWTPVGGTSVSSPSLSGIVNVAGRFAMSSAAELSLMYSNLGNNRAFLDVNYGTCGPYEGYFAASGWDFCTGIGTDSGLFGK